MQLSIEVPACKTAAEKVFPAKYYGIAKKWEEFRWLKKVRLNDLSLSGNGDERIDGSSMFDQYYFGKLDINGDGLCDWYVISLAPYSSGGDSGVLNTVYVASPKGWIRLGAVIPDDKPDGLGWGTSSQYQSEFSFSSEMLLSLWDQKTGKPYLIGWFESRRYSGRQDQDGYHIYIWDSVKNKLKELDKWQPQSAAAQVYAFFKKNGAVDTSTTGIDRLVNFDPKIEKDELEKGCSNESLLHRSSGFFKVCQTQRRIEDKLY